MPYYQGDYYQGGDNYYAAGGLLGSIAKLAGKALSFTPVGKALQVARGVAKTLGAGGRVGKALAPLGGVAGTAITLRQLRGRPASQAEMVAPDEFGGGGALGLGGLRKFGRSRRMNVTNVRALRRAGRRVRGFLKLARRFGALPISPKGKKLFKAKRRR